MTDENASEVSYEPHDRRFVGTWMLASVTRDDFATGQPLDVGVQVKGYLIYSPEGRVSVIIERMEPNKPQPTIIAYTGTWHVSGDRVIHEVDISNRQPWVGTQQLRHFAFEDDRLILSPPVSADFTHGTVSRRSLEWQRVPAPASVG